MFKRKGKKSKFFEDEPVDARFNLLANFVKKLETKADYNKAVGAMQDMFNAYQKLRGIKTDGDSVDEAGFILHGEDEK